MNKRNLFSLVAVIIIAAAVVVFGFDLFDRSISVSYKDFKSELNSGAIESATITSSKIKYTLKDGSTIYSVNNPQTPTLIEELLLNDVEIKSDDLDINAIGDMAFNLFFFALIFFGLYKLISWYT
ncbi:MAG: ATP-dependent metallopeptidase FtsH/Yme1/Tma family protein, partial [Spirochaetales bacterium]|nr:ATP-dependent metallopeptidase FtsH/Yme1/Tma family protein [Spirochaetales bacterium]